MNTGKLKPVECPDCFVIYQGARAKSRCLDCRRKRHNAIQRETNRRWRERHPEHFYQSTTAYRRARREKYREYHKQYRQKQKLKRFQEKLEQVNGRKPKEWQ